MCPILFKIGPLSIKSYGLFLALAFLVGIYFAEARAKKKGLESSLIFDFGIGTIIFSIIGARILYVLLDLSSYLKDPLSIFLPREGGIGGLSFHGGLFAGIIFGLIFAKKHKLKLGILADIVTPSLPLGYSIARWGCFLNGCCRGTETKLLWGVKFPDENFFRHPVQIYDSILNFIIFLIILKIEKYKKFDGGLFIIYLILYSLSRCIIEIFRAGVSAKILFYPFTQAQILSIAIIFVLIIYCRIVGVWKK
jgi:phosphatidylglycerol:prolipoprotein diacylglycerol transferase